MSQYINQDRYLQAFSLHQKYAKSEVLLDLVWTHCNIVADIVQELIELKKFDTSNMNERHAIQAALLHDIGVYCCGGFEWIPDQGPSERPYIQHVLVGAEILQNEGFDPVIIEAAYTHTGVGLTAEDVQGFGLNLPATDMTPKTLESQLVAYAAKYHSKAPKFKLVNEIENSLKLFGQDKVLQFQTLKDYFGTPDLDTLHKKYEPWHKAFNFKAEQLRQGGAEVNLNSAGII